MTNFTSHLNQEGVKLSTCALNIDESVGSTFILNPYFFIPVNMFFSVTSISGNILILIALQKVLSLHPPSKLLFQCLSCTDLFVGLISQPMFIFYLMTIANKNQDLCGTVEILIHISSAILCGESINTLTAISVDRLLALLLRLRYRQIVTYRRVRLFVIISWSANSALALIFLWSKRFFFLLVSAWIVLCLITSTYCYTKIYITLYRHQAQVQDGGVQGVNLGGSFINIARYKKTVSSALWVHLTLVLCYLPYTVAVAVSTLRGKSSSNVAAWNIAATVVYLNSSLNPILYCWKMEDVRRAVKETFRQCFYLTHEM